jgi:hypothetical protein
MTWLLIILFLNWFELKIVINEGKERQSGKLCKSSISLIISKGKLFIRIWRRELAGAICILG